MMLILIKEKTEGQKRKLIKSKAGQLKNSKTNETLVD